MRRLLIRPGAIGDFIVSLPALESLRSDYTEVWCRSEVIPLVSFAQRCESLAGSGLDRIGLIEADYVVERLREFDEIHSWYGTNRPDFREACRSLPFYFYPALPESGRQHAIDFYLEQVAQPFGATPHIQLEPETKRSEAVLHPFSGSARKNWPLTQWRQLAALLEPKMPVRWCCGPDDSLTDAIVIPNLRDLAQWLSGAHVFIGNDSGISHLCAAAGTHVIALFNETDPMIWAPRGPNVTILYQSATAQRVAEAVR